MRKVILTNELIKKDFRAHIFHDILTTFSVQLIWILPYSLVCLLSTLYDKRSTITLSAFMILLISLSILYSFLQLRRYWLIRNNKFNIVKDTVVNYEKKHLYGRANTFRSVIYDIHFQSYGKHTVNPGKYYSVWENLKMDWDGIFDSTFIGDEFYLVIVKNKIVYVYNTKLFELQEEIN